MSHLYFQAGLSPLLQNIFGHYKKYLKIDKKLLRPSKTNVLKGDTRKAKRMFNYKTKTKLKDLIKIMMDHELKKYNG